MKPRRKASTRGWPRKSDRRTNLPFVSLNSNSGAGRPIGSGYSFINSLVFSIFDRTFSRSAFRSRCFADWDDKNKAGRKKRMKGKRRGRRMKQKDRTMGKGSRAWKKGRIEPCECERIFKTRSKAMRPRTTITFGFSNSSSRSRKADNYQAPHSWACWREAHSGRKR